MATDGIHTRLEQLISELLAEIRRYAERKHNPARVPVPNPPATQGEIQALQEHIGRQLPNSYRAFLELHNGFTNLAFPGDMLRIADIMPPSPIHARIVEWKKLSAQYGSGEVLDGLVIADGNHPNHWVYLDPNAPSGPNEWSVVADTPSDSDTYDDLPAFFDSRLAVVRNFHKLLDEGRLKS